MKSPTRVKDPSGLDSLRLIVLRGGCRVGTCKAIYARSLAKNCRVAFRRERWETPDQDFIDLDWLGQEADDSRLIVLFHGLEGCSQSHYAISLMKAATQGGWRGVVPHFRRLQRRGQSAVRSYHSGDSREIDWILRRSKDANRHAKIYVVGVSLGGNMLLKWLGEEGAAASLIVERARCGIGADGPRGRSAECSTLVSIEWLYTSHFLNLLKPMALAKSRPTTQPSMRERFAPV